MHTVVQYTVVACSSSVYYAVYAVMQYAVLCSICSHATAHQLICSVLHATVYCHELHDCLYCIVLSSSASPRRLRNCILHCILHATEYCATDATPAMTSTCYYDQQYAELSTYEQRSDVHDGSAVIQYTVVQCTIECSLCAT